MYTLLSLLVQMLEHKQGHIDSCTDRFEVLNADMDRWHERSWNSNMSYGAFCTSYRTHEKLSNEFGNNRNKISSDKMTYHQYWGDIYQSLVNESKPILGFLIDSLNNQGVEKELSKEGMANLVVSFVQDIPYSYILSKDCSTLENRKHPCVGNAYLGILAPYEFIHSLHGDCDTRSVLIYAILEEMGFDPMIVISREYAHAMLAINIPAVGDYLTFKGKNYYFWETTAKNWPVGVLPPGSNNINYWKIALVNEL